MDIFMMTSEFEGLPIALLEAMSMELPMVATDAGGIKEVVRDGVEGFLKPVDQPMDLEEPLSKLVEDEDLRKEMGKRGRVRVKEAFSLERMVRELEEVYVEVLSNRGNGQSFNR
jgi:glycosyltransferase involved in cell wall biosynthesis